MKKIRLKNKLICLITFILLNANFISYATYRQTGHIGFNDIQINEGFDATLLVDMDYDYKQKLLREVDRKAFGWSVNTDAKNVIVTYEKKSIFSRYNKTSAPISFEYAASVTKTIETSVAVEGKIALKASGKIDGISIGLDKEIKRSIGLKGKVEIEESTNFTVDIPPGKKTTLSVKGEATMSNGASKFYIFGICFNSGFWEYIDVNSEYYELLEE